MSKVEKISVALTHDMTKILKSAVSSGEYASVSEVVREATREWASKRKREQAEIEILRAAWTQGIESGTGRFNSINELLTEAHSQYEKHK